MTILQFIMKEVKVNPNDFYVRKYLVKFKRRIKATITEQTGGKFQLCIGDLAWHKDNLDDCKVHIIERYSNFAETITGKSVCIKILAQ